MTEGFLGTAAPRYADLILLLEVAMGAGLLVGAGLARARRFRAHAWCQSGIVLLNLAVIVIVMIPSFRAHVSPGLPLKLGKAYYAYATVHAALGATAEIAGLYILLAAGTSIVPPRFRITRYKLWMRTLLVLWWVVLLSGLALYARWYVPDWCPRAAPPASLDTARCCPQALSPAAGRFEHGGKSRRRHLDTKMNRGAFAVGGRVAGPVRGGRGVSASI